MVLNLLRTKTYRSDLPWVMKIWRDGHLATELYIYVDDGPASVFCREICWAAARRFAALCSNYGVQDKASKRTFLTPTPGPWAGTVSRTDQREVEGLVSQKKWVKTKALIRELERIVQKAKATNQKWSHASLVRVIKYSKGRNAYDWGPGGKNEYKKWHDDPGRSVPRQRLLEIRGFLNYVVRTYPWIKPCPKGLHLTIDGWREGRETGGWRGKRLKSFPGRRAHDEEPLRKLAEEGSGRGGRRTREGSTPTKAGLRHTLLEAIH